VLAPIGSYVAAVGQTTATACPEGTTTTTTGATSLSDCVAPPTSSIATAVAAGGQHTCALVIGGTVKCWGSDVQGQLGGGMPAGGGSSTPVDVAGVTGATGLASGAAHSCALMAGGTVKCWGWNFWGQLGDGIGLISYSTPVDVVGVTDATAISAGPGHTCAVVTGGAVKCWGWNNYGQLGDGPVGGVSSTPMDVVGITGATALITGEYHTCALLTGGSVKCWGYNGFGQLGDGSTADSSTPVDVVGITGATDIAAGAYHSCALVAGGSLKCWGRGDYGQLGDGAAVNSSTSVDVVGITGATDIAAGRDHSCAVVAGGEMKCWGYNFYGQLGEGSTADSPIPVDAVGITGATAVSNGTYHSCALGAGGWLRCWGWNAPGHLGDGTNTDSPVPVGVLGLG